tara:strand:+ start:1150 stop:1998 length:849 start_codon:yes stop_codon:yes gene_type:complete
MKLSKRIIPKLDIKGENLVKGINLEGLRVLGKPEVFASNYYKNGADELIFQDIISSLYGIKTLQNVIKKTASEIFIPLTIGGGINSTNDIYDLLRCGADKVSINSAAIKNPNLIKKAIKLFGSSTIVASIETQLIENKYYAFTESGRNKSNKELIPWIQELQDLGVGEITITFIDSEGTGKGIDLKLVESISKFLSVPIILNGGIGNKNHAFDLLSINKISGLAISSMFHYDRIKNYKITDEDYPLGNIDFLLNNKSNFNFETISIIDLKKFLLSKKIEINI